MTSAVLLWGGGHQVRLLQMAACTAAGTTRADAMHRLCTGQEMAAGQKSKPCRTSPCKAVLTPLDEAHGLGLAHIANTAAGGLSAERRTGPSKDVVLFSGAFLGEAVAVGGRLSTSSPHAWNPVQVLATRGGRPLDVQQGLQDG